MRAVNRKAPPDGGRDGAIEENPSERGLPENYPIDDDAASGAVQVKSGRLLGTVGRRRRRREPFARATLRIKDIERLVGHRHGRGIPQHDDPRDGYVFCVGNAISAHLDQNEDQIGFLTDWIRKWAPWITKPEISAGAVLSRMHVRRLMMNDAAAGRMLGLRLAERDACGITTISPTDLTAEEWKAVRKERKRANDRRNAERRRRRKGAGKRESDQPSIEKIQPWRAEGVSRRTWYRQRQKQNGTALSHGSESELAQARRTGRKRSENQNGTARRAQVVDGIERDAVVPIQVLLFERAIMHLRQAGGKKPPGRSDESDLFDGHFDD